MFWFLLVATFGPPWPLFRIRFQHKHISQLLGCRGLTNSMSSPTQSKHTWMCTQPHISSRAFFSFLFFLRQDGLCRACGRHIPNHTITLFLTRIPYSLTQNETFIKENKTGKPGYCNITQLCPNTQVGQHQSEPSEVPTIQDWALALSSPGKLLSLHQVTRGQTRETTKLRRNGMCGPHPAFQGFTLCGRPASSHNKQPVMLPWPGTGIFSLWGASWLPPRNFTHWGEKASSHQLPEEPQITFLGWRHLEKKGDGERGATSHQLCQVPGPLWASAPHTTTRTLRFRPETHCPGDSHCWALEDKGIPHRP